jgi:Fibronectin type III domain
MAQLRIFRILLDFAKYAPGDLRIFASHILFSIKGNPALPNPAISMQELGAQINTYAGLISEALDGSRKVIADRDKQGVTLINMLKQLAGYVEFVANDDVSVITSSGFKFAPTSRKQPAPRNESIRTIDFGDRSGELKLKAVDVPGAASYEVRSAVRQIDRSPRPDEWTVKQFSDTRKFLIVTGLTPGTFYVFQVRALIGETFTDWSNSATHMCK